MNAHHILHTRLGSVATFLTQEQVSTDGHAAIVVIDPEVGTITVTFAQEPGPEMSGADILLLGVCGEATVSGSRKSASTNPGTLIPGDRSTLTLLAIQGVLVAQAVRYALVDARAYQVERAAAEVIRGWEFYNPLAFGPMVAKLKETLK